MIYDAKIIILYKEENELNYPIVLRLFQYENINIKTVKISSKSNYYNLHGTRVDGLYVSEKLKELISNDDILDVLEPMLNISIFNSKINWFSED